MPIKPEIIMPGVPTEFDVKEAMHCIVRNRNLPVLNYAINYAIESYGMTGQDLYYQVLRVQNNIAKWRGDEARSIKTTLRAWVKANSHKGRYRRPTGAL